MHDCLWLTRALKLTGVLVALVLVLSCCGSRLPKAMRTQPTTLAEPSQVAQQPGEFTGSTVLWGGRILGLAPGRQGTELEILQFELDSSDRPRPGQHTGGRFLLRTRAFLDPALYAPGREITVAGAIEGHAERNVGQHPYVYPVVVSDRIHLWPERTPSDARYYDPWGPRFYFGYGMYRYW